MWVWRSLLFAPPHGYLNPKSCIIILTKRPLIMETSTHCLCLPVIQKIFYHYVIEKKKNRSKFSLCKFFLHTYWFRYVSMYMFPETQHKFLLNLWIKEIEKWSKHELKTMATLSLTNVYQLELRRVITYSCMGFFHIYLS